jgi:FecR protein/Putative zinc-finger
MKPACWHAGGLLQRRAAGLSGAEGLRLEEHLAHCPECREAASLLSGLRTLHAITDAPLDEGARRRVIARALASDGPGSQHARAHAPARAQRLSWALALSALCALASVAVLRSHPLQRAEPLASERVLSGELRRVDRAPLTTTLPSDTALETDHGARLALAHATVELRPATRVRWNAELRVLRLDAGSVTVSVDPLPHRSVSVATDHFDVRVLGTVFEVDLARVLVQRGRVRVESHDGTAPVILEAGARTSFELPSKPAANALDAGIAPPPSAANHAPSTRARSDLSALLDRARGELAAHHVAAARRSLHQAIASQPAPAQLAEALSLRAECALVADDYAAARSGYLEVARRFSQLPAAESALFAAGRIAAEHGDRAGARTLFERYAARYPNGSFAREVERRLRDAGPP